MTRVWSYERISIDRPNYAHGLKHCLFRARAWSYRRNDDAMEQTRGLYMHHNIIFYRGELDGMIGTMIRWAPYARFKNLVGLEFEEAWYSRASRIPLIWHAIVEVQMSDRMLRQVGEYQDILDALLNMVELRATREGICIIDYKELQKDYIVT